MRGPCQHLAVDGPSLRDARMLGNDNLRSNGPSDGLLSRPTPGLQHDDMENRQHQVCWERFLQKKNINVLLVESDDSTRQVVSALLRHCMYQGLFILLPLLCLLLKNFVFI